MSDKFIPLVGEYKGQEGVMVGRICESSYDDIQLRFDDGEMRWFRFREVKSA